MAERDPLSLDYEAEELTRNALGLLAAWTHGKAGEADNILCELAVDTAAIVRELARKRAAAEPQP